MRAVRKYSIKAILAGMFLAMAAGQAFAANDLAGVTFEHSMTVGGKELVLNGAGVRHKFAVKVYAAALYLQEPKHTVDGVMKADGPRRVRLVMLRDLSSDDLGNAFMTAFSENVSEENKAKVATQVSQYGEMFGRIGSLKKGDIVDTDWIPGAGNQCYLNGKKFGPVIHDIHFYNSLLRIWLGDKPVDPTLKTHLLEAAGHKSETTGHKSEATGHK
jgi:hypothetical protein